MQIATIQNRGAADSPELDGHIGRGRLLAKTFGAADKSEFGHCSEWLTADYADITDFQCSVETEEAMR
jgi:hypothetical protein